MTPQRADRLAYTVLAVLALALLIDVAQAAIRGLA